MRLCVGWAGVCCAAGHAHAAAVKGVAQLSSPFGAVAATPVLQLRASDRGPWPLEGDPVAYPCAAPMGFGAVEAAWSPAPLPPSQIPGQGVNPEQGIERTNGWSGQRRPPVHMPQHPQLLAQGEALERLAQRHSLTKGLPPTPALRASCYLVGERGTLAPQHSAPDALPPPAALDPDPNPLVRSGSSSAPGPFTRHALGLAAADSGEAAALRQACDSLPRQGSMTFVLVSPATPGPAQAAGAVPPATPLLQPMLHSVPSALTSLGSVGSGALRAELSGLGSRLGSGALCCDAALLEELGSASALGGITAAQAAEQEAVWQAVRRRLEQQPS